MLPAALRLAVQPFFPQERSWADFLVQMSCFVLGFALYVEPRFLEAVRRDWSIHLLAGLAATGAAMAIALSGGSLDVQAPPRGALDVLFWILISLDGWSWGLFLLFLGMRYLDETSRWLKYGQEAILPFFVLHQPVIIVLAYYGVQWQAPLVVKLLFVVIGSFGFTLGLFEVLVRRIGVLRLAFGVKRVA
jgi:glucans biosynthesis protein C